MDNFEPSKEEWDELQRIASSHHEATGIDGMAENSAYLMALNSPILAVIVSRGISPAIAFGLGRLMGQVFQGVPREIFRAFFQGMRLGRDLNARLALMRSRRTGN